MDISSSMLERAKAALTPLLVSTSSKQHQVDFILLESSDYPSHLQVEQGQIKRSARHTRDAIISTYIHIQEKFDFVYSFDVLVHVDLHTIFKTFQQVN